MNLDIGKGSWVTLYPEAVRTSPEEFKCLWEYGVTQVPPTPNPRANGRSASPFIKRLQATFGAPYQFGAQLSTGIPPPEEGWPDLIKKVLADARLRSERPDTLKIAHVNWYAGGDVALSPHRDDESKFQAGAPIYSYTFLSDPSKPRKFQVYTLDQKLIQDINLPHQSLLIMGGNMQTTHLHGVKATMRKDMAEAQRINITVRSLPW
jgi:alkylated DNA repair dioxygenase AlkB